MLDKGLSRNDLDMAITLYNLLMSCYLSAPAYPVTTFRIACCRSDNCEDSSEFCLRVNLDCPSPSMILDVDLNSATFHQKKNNDELICAESDKDCDYAVDKSSINHTMLNTETDTDTCTGRSACEVYYEWSVDTGIQHNTCKGRHYVKLQYKCHVGPLPPPSTRNVASTLSPNSTKFVQSMPTIDDNTEDVTVETAATVNNNTRLLHAHRAVARFPQSDTPGLFVEN